jgi:hypothetical protein
MELGWIRKRGRLPGRGTFGDPRDVFIRRVVRSKSFCDVGGLWGTTQEKVTVAAEAGAARLAIIDVTPLGSELWQAFDERLESTGVTGVECISADIASTEVDPFQVVHCSGVIYHAPNPIEMLAALRRIAIEHLVLTSVVFPPEIRNRAGTISFSPGQALFVPHLDEHERSTLQLHMRDVGLSGAGGLDIPVQRWSLDDHAPWWWLFTASVLHRMIAVAGFEVVDEAPYWDGKAHVFLARSA